MLGTSPILTWSLFLDIVVETYPIPLRDSGIPWERLEVTKEAQLKESVLSASIVNACEEMRHTANKARDLFCSTHAIDNKNIKNHSIHSSYSLLSIRPFSTIPANVCK